MKVKETALVVRINSNFRQFEMLFYKQPSQLISSPTELNSSTEYLCDEPFRFNCGNSRCIREVLVCDDRNNCGNAADEKFCGEFF